VFNLGQDTCNYQQNHLHEETIKKIIIIKHAYQNKIINKILLLKTELKKKVINNNKSLEKDDYILDKEKKLAQSYHFDYQKTAWAVAKKRVIKAVKKIARVDQRRLRISKQRSARE
jgi:hypothetical protein